MTLSIAKLIEMRDRARTVAETMSGNIAEIESYEEALLVACSQCGGGLLERHAMLEELWEGWKEAGTPTGSAERLNVALNALRASEEP